MRTDELKELTIGDLLEAYMVLRNLEAALETMQGDGYSPSHREMAAGFQSVIREARAVCHRRKTEARE